MSQFNLTPQFCRRALVQGQEFIKINSFNRKHRMVACPVNLKSLTWKSVKDHKKHEDYKGSVDTIEFRSISLENLNIKLKFDSRTLNFLCETKEQAIEWGGIFAWLLSRAQETRGEVSNSVKPRVGFLRSSPGKTKRTRSSTVSAGISPHLHDLSSHESFSNPFAVATNPTGENDGYEEKSLRNRLASPSNQYGSSMSNARLRPELENQMSSLYKEDKFAMYTLVAKLMDGATFLRYKPHHQKPKSRFVWFSIMLDSLMYSLDREHKETTKPRGLLPTMNITAITEGCTANILEHHRSTIEVEKSFTVVEGENMLHLQCETVEMRTNWIKGLRFIMWMVRHYEDGKIEEFYYWYCVSRRKQKLSRQSVFNLMMSQVRGSSFTRNDEESDSLNPTRKRGSSAGARMSTKQANRRMSFISQSNQQRGRVVSSVAEEDNEEEEKNTEDKKISTLGKIESVYQMDDAAIDALDVSIDDQMSRNEETDTGQEKQKRSSIGESILLSKEFSEYLKVSGDDIAIKHWHFLEELSKTDLAITDACGSILETFQNLTETKEDVVFNEKDGATLRDNMIQHDPLNIFFASRRKSKLYLEEIYVKWIGSTGSNSSVGSDDITISPTSSPTSSPAVTMRIKRLRRLSSIQAKKTAAREAATETGKEKGVE
mgnify:FL=1